MSYKGIGNSFVTRMVLAFCLGGLLLSFGLGLMEYRHARDLAVSNNSQALSETSRKLQQSLITFIELDHADSIVQMLEVYVKDPRLIALRMTHDDGRQFAVGPWPEDLSDRGGLDGQRVGHGRFRPTRHEPANRARGTVPPQRQTLRHRDRHRRQHAAAGHPGARHRATRRPVVRALRADADRPVPHATLVQQPADAARPSRGQQRRRQAIRASRGEHRRGVRPTRRGPGTHAPQPRRRDRSAALPRARDGRPLPVRALRPDQHRLGRPRLRRQPERRGHVPRRTHQRPHRSRHPRPRRQARPRRLPPEHRPHRAGTHQPLRAPADATNKTR